jgi:hypothetical protein
MKKVEFILLFFLMCITPGIALSGTDATSQHSETWQHWVDEYEQDLSSEDGWLSLVGLFWLKDGDNSIGAAVGNDHRFPAGTPDKFGTIVVDEGMVEFTRAADEIRIDGNDVDKQILLQNETVVSYGTYSFFVIKRERGFAIRLKNTANPSISGFGGVRFYPYSPSWQIPAQLIKHASPQKIKVATVYETIRENDSAGWLEFEFEGKIIRLQAVSYGPDTPMSLMFADQTRLSTTYGAGRYLNVEWPQEGDQTMIDFNRAYNPPCAITAFATCPLPPRQNRMDIAVEAGELFNQH